MLWCGGVCSQSCCGRFSSGSQVSRGKRRTVYLELFIAVGIFLYAVGILHLYIL